MVTLHIYGFTYESSWPFLLVILGGGMYRDDQGGRRAASRCRGRRAPMFDQDRTAKRMLTAPSARATAATIPHVCLGGLRDSGRRHIIGWLDPHLQCTRPTTTNGGG